MLKKIYQKGGILIINNSHKDIKYGYYIINNYDKKKNIDDYKKGYYSTQGIIYPH